MFEDQQPQEPEDIFSSTEPVAGKPQAMTPTQPGATPAPVSPASEAVTTEPPVGSNKKLVIIAVVVVVLVAAFVIVLLSIWFARQGEAPANGTEATIPAITQPTVPSPTIQPTTTTIPEPEPEPPADTDGDGLTDDEETALGTSTTVADSDEDGLSDLEEVKVWNTDPLNDDTDGDGFKDGDEVDEGYDPNQAGGKLLDINNL